MPDFAHHLTRLLQSYTYVAVLLLVMLESLGIPLPGELVVPLFGLAQCCLYAVLARREILVRRSGLLQRLFPRVALGRALRLE